MQGDDVRTLTYITDSLEINFLSLAVSNSLVVDTERVKYLVEP